jgi:hypothetical protein
VRESGSRVSRMPTHRLKQRRDEWGTQIVAGHLFSLPSGILRGRNYSYPVRARDGDYRKD